MERFWKKYKRVQISETRMKVIASFQEFALRFLPTAFLARTSRH